MIIKSPLYIRNEGWIKLVKIMTMKMVKTMIIAAMKVNVILI